MLDKRFIVTEEGLKPVKVELDITITKAQAAIINEALIFKLDKTGCFDDGQEELIEYLEGKLNESEL